MMIYLMNNSLPLNTTSVKSDQCNRQELFPFHKFINFIKPAEIHQKSGS